MAAAFLARATLTGSLMLVSFNLASNRPDNFSELCENLQATAADPTCLEVLVKIDDGDEAMHACIAAEAAKRPFPVKALSTPGEGYFSLWKSLNRLHRELCDPAAYFVCNINDEIRFNTPQWDVALAKWKHLFPDDIFRLKTSIYKLRNYGDFWECGFAPENYAFYTKRWIDVAGGDWNPCHGPDAFQQFVAYYLYWANYPSKEQFNRDVPIFDIEISGEGVFKGLTDAQFWDRVRKGWVAWYIMVGHAMQTEASRRARMLQAAIMSHAAGHPDAEIRDDRRSQHVSAVARGQTAPLVDETGRPLRFPYRLSWLRITWTNWIRHPMQNYYGGDGPEIWHETFVNIPFYFFPSLHPASAFRRNLKARRMHPPIRFGQVTAGASDHIPHAPPNLLIDQTAEPWGSNETDEDTYFWLTRKPGWRPRRIEFLAFSPGNRSHIRDVRVMVRGRRPDGAPDEWIAVPARLKGSGRDYAEKLELPQTDDNVRLRIEVEPRAVRGKRFDDVGLACLSKSKGDKRNWLPEGRGIYVREMKVVG